MDKILIDLPALLQDDKCSRVELYDMSGEKMDGYWQSRPGVWGCRQPGLLIATEELAGNLEKNFGDDIGRIVCCLAHEKVEYRLEGGGVRIERKIRQKIKQELKKEREEWRLIIDSMGIPKSKRKRKFEQAQHFVKMVELALANKKKKLRILDLACGRSYLGFVLVHALMEKGVAVELTGVDANKTLVEKSRQIAADLAWKNVCFEENDLSCYKITPGQYDMVVMLHGCDTLSDEAIRIGCEGEVPLFFVAPCCQHEFRHLWKKHAFQWITRHGLLEQRLADIITDGFRCLVLEAFGYRVKTLRFADSDITPKNILLQGIRKNKKPERAVEARALLNEFSIKPRLIQLLDNHFPA